MGRAYRAIVFLGLCGALAACAAISGLDQIQVNACVPDGCDASAGTDGLPPVPLPDASSGGAGSDADDDATSTDETSGGDGGLGEEIGEDAADGTSAQTADAARRGDSSTEPDATSATRDARADAPIATVDAADAGDGADGAGSGCGTLYFQDSFASDTNGWTLDPGWTIAAECAAPPAPQKGNPDPTSDHTGVAGSGVVGAFVCGNNPTGQTTPYRYATSRAMDTSNAPTLKLAFWRWLNTDASEWMASTVDVYDGSAWVNVYTNPSGTANYVLDAAWTYEETDVTAQKNSAFQVRFGYSIGNAAVYEMSSWNIDDVSISAGSCE